MTRINLVDPSELTDQHLFAEFREIKMVPRALRRSIDAAIRRGEHPVEGVLKKVPSRFTLNTGHVSFFYDKGKYLASRYADIKRELDVRGYQYNKNSVFDPDGVYHEPRFFNDYVPTPEAVSLVRERIAIRIADKPEWYRKRK